MVAWDGPPDYFKVGDAVRLRGAETSLYSRVEAQDVGTIVKMGDLPPRREHRWAYVRMWRTGETIDVWWAWLEKVGGPAS